MKTRNLLLALGCAAAFTACTNNDEPAVAPAPAMRTVTLSVDVAEPADTRVGYTEEDNTYKFEWRAGDELHVFYYHDYSNKEATFTIDDSSISGKKADFDGELPSTFTGDVTIVYSGKVLEDLENSGVANFLRLTGYYGQTDNVASALADRTLLYATATVTEAGGLPDVKLNHMISYLLLKEGLQVTQEGLTLGEGDPELLLKFDVPGYIAFDYEGYRNEGTGSIFGNIEVSDGKLTHDCLVPLFVGPEGKNNYNLYLSGCLSDYGNYQNNASQPAFTYKPGVIYEVKANNEKWQPVGVVVPKVGMVIGANGCFYENAAAAEEAGTTAEAMIAYLGNEAEDADHGLAIALELASENYVTWDNSGTNNGDMTAAEIVAAWAENHEVEGGTWRLPSAYDWQRMFIGCGSNSTYVSNLTNSNNNMEFSHGNFSTLWNTATSTYFQSDGFWSSTELDADNAWRVFLDSSTAAFDPDPKDGAGRVLACLAF